MYTNTPHFHVALLFECCRISLLFVKQVSKWIQNWQLRAVVSRLSESFKMRKSFPLYLCIPLLQNMVIFLNGEQKRRLYIAKIRKAFSVSVHITCRQDNIAKWSLFYPKRHHVCSIPMKFVFELTYFATPMKINVRFTTNHHVDKCLYTFQMMKSSHCFWYS